MVRIEPKVVVAATLGLLLVGGSWYMANQKPAKTVTAPVSSIVTTEKARSFIPITDTDNNRIPDWQDAFDLAEVNLDELSTTTPYEPESEGGKLVVGLAEQMTAARASGDTTFSPQTAINRALLELQLQAIDEIFTTSDIRISDDNSLAAKKAYGNRVAEIIFDNAIEGTLRDELIVLDDALQSSNESMLEELDPRITSYTDMIDDMLALRVPSDLAAEHVALLNAYQALLKDNQAFRDVFNDALSSMVRFKRYINDTRALYTAIINLYQKLHDAGIQWNESDPASQLIAVE